MFLASDDSTYHKISIQNLEFALEHWKNYVGIMDAQYHGRTYARTGKLDWDELTREVETDIEIAKTIEKFEIDIKVEGVKEGDEFPVGTDLNILAEINSTFDLIRVGLLINGERIGWANEEPFSWNAERFSQLEDMNLGSYVFEFTAIDSKGNKAEKMIQITIK